MKKLLLSIVLQMLVCCMGLFASSVDDPLPLNTGRTPNTANETTAYYTYTAQDDILLILTRKGSMYFTVSKDGTSATSIDGASFNGKYYYPIEKGTKVYIEVKVYEAESISFNAAVRAAELNKGDYCANAIAMEDGFEAFIPSMMRNYITYPTYVSFTTVDEGGVLKVELSSSCAYAKIAAGCDGKEVDLRFAETNVGYEANYVVEPNTTYILQLSLYADVIGICTLTHPTIGSTCELAFSMNEKNELPAEAGIYWYKYVPEADGFITFSSDAKLENNGSISIWSSCSATSAAASNAGSFDLRYKVSANKACYACIDKAAATSGVEAFSMSFAAPGEGDSFTQPQTITTGATVPMYATPYYYKVQVPASATGAAKVMMSVAPSVELENSETLFNLYEASDAETVVMSDKSFSLPVVSGTEYIVEAVNKEGKELPFTLNFKEIETGDVCDNPCVLDAAGQYTVQPCDVRYYSYTAAGNGWLSVKLPNNKARMSFPKSCSSFDGDRDMVVDYDKAIYKTKCEAGVTYLMKLENLKTEGVLEVAEEGYAAGESCETAIEVALGTVALPATAQISWYQIKMDKTGLLAVSTTLPLEYTSDYSAISNISYKINDCSASMTDLTNYSSMSFSGNISVAEGDVVYIYVKQIVDRKDQTLTLSFREPEPGESCATAIPIDVPEAVMPKTTSSTSMWYFINLAVGDLSVRTVSYISAEFLKDCGGEVLAKAAYVTYDPVTYASIYGFDYNVTEAGRYILHLTSSTAGKVLTFAGAAIDNVTGLGKALAHAAYVRVADNALEIAPENNQPTRVLVTDVQGHSKSMTISSVTTVELESGVYMVTVNGQTVKVLVK